MSGIQFRNAPGNRGAFFIHAVSPQNFAQGAHGPLFLVAQTGTAAVNGGIPALLQIRCALRRELIVDFLEKATAARSTERGKHFQYLADGR